MGFRLAAPTSIIVGKDDEVIDPERTIKFMTDHNYENYDIVQADIGHQIPPVMFQSLLRQVSGKFK